METPSFPKESKVIGWSLIKFLNWAQQSSELIKMKSISNVTVLELPPIQRSAVWRPKQVIDLWDSVLQGLPIGLFYLIDPGDNEQEDHRRAGESPDGDRASLGQRHYDLLDGQQRLHALLLVLKRTHNDRCLWIDLGGNTPHLYLTSRAQPFGYQLDGTKLPIYQRRDAREKFEDGHKIYIKDEQGALKVDTENERRPAYDIELFSGRLVRNDIELPQKPPTPFISTKAYMLYDLFEAWTAEGSGDNQLTRLRAAAPEANEKALNILHAQLHKFHNAEIALFLVKPENDEQQLSLFERVGAGGTPLSAEERLYSIYKHHVPEVRDAVKAIYNDDNVGRVLPATKIVATALRIAGANRAASPSFSVPDVASFATEMRLTDDGKRTEFRVKLEQLLPIENGPLLNGFRSIKKLITCGSEAYWLPDVLLCQFPAELWQVLVFWATRASNPISEGSQREVVRFALFWHLCCFNHNKAATGCFKELSIIDSSVFPAQRLYKLMTDANGDHHSAWALNSPNKFRVFCKSFPETLETENWRTDAERFGLYPNRDDFAAHWWWKATKLLPWFQKEYVRKRFSSFAPLSDHEEDLPYDIDHICPRNDWYCTYNAGTRVVGVSSHAKEMHEKNRSSLGDSVGNKRIVATEDNRGDQDADISVKMGIFGDESQFDPSAISEMKNFGFFPDGKSLVYWRRVKNPAPKVADRPWDRGRLIAFQQAVEFRAYELCQHFFSELEYEQWLDAAP